jgi:hypothetical protein
MQDRDDALSGAIADLVFRIQANSAACALRRAVGFESIFEAIFEVHHLQMSRHQHQHHLQPDPFSSFNH